MIKCDLCSGDITKYELDFNQTGAIRMGDYTICYDCAKQIAIKFIEDN